MMNEQPIQLTPELIIYRQVERIHQLRAQGLAAMESLKILSAALKPLRTPEYNEKVKALIQALDKETNSDEAFFSWYESLIDILSGNGYWLVQRKYVGWEE